MSQPRPSDWLVTPQRQQPCSTRGDLRLQVGGIFMAVAAMVARTEKPVLAPAPIVGTSRAKQVPQLTPPRISGLDNSQLCHPAQALHGPPPRCPPAVIICHPGAFVDLD